MTREEAESMTWWSDFLDARMKGFRAALRLGRTEAEIAHMFGLSAFQLSMLINRAYHLNSES
jgi:hypothetical protein